MNNILQWQPEKSRLLATAKIDNIHHLRKDLETLAAWIKTKADEVALDGKAGVSKVAEVEKAIGELQSRLAAQKNQAEESAAQLAQRLDHLEKWRQSSDAAIQQCQRLEQTFRKIDAEAREHFSAQLDLAAEQTTLATRLAEEARQSADACRTAQTGCEQSSNAMVRRVEELSVTWDGVHEKMASLGAGVEQDVARLADQAQTIHELLSQSQASAESLRQLHADAVARQTDVEETLTRLVQTAESNASAVVQHSQTTTAAAELASKLKSECEALMDLLRLKSEELAATWQNTEREFSDVSGRMEQSAAKAASEASRASEVLAETERLAESSAEMRSELQTGQAELGERLAAVDQKLQEASQEAAKAREHREICEQLGAQLRASSKGIDEKLRNLEAELDNWRNNFGGFWGRLKWLAVGKKDS